MRWRRRSRSHPEPHQPISDRGTDERRRAAFTDFHDEHATAIVRYFRLRIADAQDAEDVAADVFLQAWRAYPPDDRGSPRSWLFAIAHNTVANHYRRQKSRRTAHVLNQTRIDEVADRDATPEETYLQREQGSALVCLPASQREVVELRLTGLQGAEIATAIGRTESAVKMLQ